MNAPNIIPPLARFEAHPLRLVIQDRLRRVAVGEVITYDEIDQLVGFDSREEAPHLLQYARDVLIDEGFVFDVVTGKGLKRASDSNAVAIVEGQAKRALSAANKGARIVRTVNYEALSPGDRIRFGVAQVRIGIVQQFGRLAIGRKVAAAINSGGDPKQLAGAVAGSLKQFK
jgi:hypothetical protein